MVSIVGTKNRKHGLRGFDRPFEQAILLRNRQTASKPRMMMPVSKK